eukprot:m.132834 g.132834  ORF g.132834 m.132834 type:complete len:184 (+) comp29634_c1_seq2:347-898(+)
MDRFKLVQAVSSDALAIFEVVNEAYAVELGDSGIAFKNTGRYQQLEQVLTDIAAATSAPDTQSYQVLVDKNETDTNSSRKLLGCIYTQVFHAEDKRCVCEFGPICVSPTLQGQGAGAALITTAEEFGKANGATVMVLHVVNHRPDMVEYYVRRGYHDSGRIEDYPWKGLLTRPTHFVMMEKVL